jgi:hypothetical protein
MLMDESIKNSIDPPKFSVNVSIKRVQRQQKRTSGPLKIKFGTGKGRKKAGKDERNGFKKYFMSYKRVNF